MNADIERNSHDLARTSSSAPPPEAEQSEAEYLAREIADSKQALIRTSQDLKDNLRSSLELAPWIKQYPWAALGVATVAGFTAATVVAPKPGQSVAERLSELFAKRPTQESRGLDDSAICNAPRSASQSQQSRSLLDSLFGLTRTLIETLLVAAIRSAASSPPSGNQDSVTDL